MSNFPIKSNFPVNISLKSWQGVVHIQNDHESSDVKFAPKCLLGNGFK